MFCDISGTSKPVFSTVGFLVNIIPYFCWLFVGCSNLFTIQTNQDKALLPYIELAPLNAGLSSLASVSLAFQAMNNPD